MSNGVAPAARRPASPVLSDGTQRCSQQYRRRRPPLERGWEEFSPSEFPGFAKVRGRPKGFRSGRGNGGRLFVSPPLSAGPVYHSKRPRIHAFVAVGRARPDGADKPTPSCEAVEAADHDQRFRPGMVCRRCGMRISLQRGLAGAGPRLSLPILDPCFARKTSVTTNIPFPEFGLFWFSVGAESVVLLFGYPSTRQKRKP